MNLFRRLAARIALLLLAVGGLAAIPTALACRQRSDQDRPHPADDRPVRLHRPPDRRRGQAVPGAERRHGRPAARSSSILKDDAGVADTTRRLAQELVVNDKVTVLAGFGLTPLALATAPIATQSKTPMVVMAAATSSITEASPYIVRTSFTLPQVTVGIAEWAAKNGIKKVGDAGHRLRPRHRRREVLQEPLHAERRHRCSASCARRCAAPTSRRSCRGCATPSPMRCSSSCRRAQGAAFMKQFAERGLDKAGIRLIATGDVTDDDQLNDMGDVALGVVTSHHYSAAHPSRGQQEVRRRLRRRPTSSRPNFMAVGGYDGMRVIYEALEGHQGQGGGDALLAAMKGQVFESPRGQVLIDAQTRDIVQDVYIRKVERVDGQLCNVEFDVHQGREGPGKAEVSRSGGTRLTDADPAVRRHRLRHAAVRAGRRPGRDAGADELHQPRARRLRDGRRLRHGAADEPRRRAVPRHACRLAFVVAAALGALLERTLYRPMYAKPHLDQVLFSIGLVFMAVAAVDYFIGSQQQNVQLPPGCTGRFEIDVRSASAATGCSSSSSARRSRSALQWCCRARASAAGCAPRSTTRASPRASASTSTACSSLTFAVGSRPGRPGRRARRRDPRARPDVPAQVHDLFPDRRRGRRHDHDHRPAAGRAAAGHRRRDRQVLRAQARRLHRLRADDRDPAACGRRACSRARSAGE